MTVSQLETPTAGAIASAKSMFNRFKTVADAEGRALTPTEMASVQSATDEAKRLKARLGERQSSSSFDAAFNDLTAGMTDSRGTVSSYRTRGGSIGQEIIDSEVGKYLIGQRGRFPTGAWRPRVVNCRPWCSVRTGRAVGLW
jgi:hypothetical protein